MTDISGTPILVSGGAGYIGSHVAYQLKLAGFAPIVLDNLVNGHLWATHHASVFRQGDIADADCVRELCRTFKPAAAMHFAAFIEVGESVNHPSKYFENNRDKAAKFFGVLADEGVSKVVFSSTAAVYGETTGSDPLTEDHQTCPINPYGQSKRAAEIFLRDIPSIRSVVLRYFNVAGSAADQGLGEAHFPETHLIPRIVAPLIGLPAALQRALGLNGGFTIYGNDYGTRDGTAVRDYLHVLDLAEAHVRALTYILRSNQNEILNLGSGSGYSVKEIVQAARVALNRPDFVPEIAQRRVGDPATLVASSEKAQRILGWKPERDISDMILSAAAWHQSARYQRAIQHKAGLLNAA